MITSARASSSRCWALRWKRRLVAAMPSIMCCSMARRVWAKPPWPWCCRRNGGAVQGHKCTGLGTPARHRWVVGQPAARDLLFIDEIHRLGRVAEELLYPAMEDRRLDLTVGKGSQHEPVPSTCRPSPCGATTRAGSLSSPLRDRFGLIQRLEFYGQDDLEAIVERTAGLIGVTLTPQARSSIAASCRGTPRIANRLLRRVRMWPACVVGAIRLLIRPLLERSSLHRVDHRGLDASDRRLLRLLIDHHSGGPVGLETLAAALGDDPVTLETVVEPFLLQQGLLMRTPAAAWSRMRPAVIWPRRHEPFLVLLMSLVLALPVQALDLQGLYEQALTASRQGIVEALPLWDRFLEQAPEDAAALSNRGNVRLALGDPSGAIADQSASIVLAPEESDPHLNRGTAEEALQDWSAAADDYLDSERDPQDASALYNLANVRGSQGDWLLARALLPGCSCPPRLAMARSSEALAAWQVGDLDWAEAELRKLIRRYPLFADARAALGGLLWREGSSGEAESHWPRPAGLISVTARPIGCNGRRWPPQPTADLMAFLALEAS